MEVKSWKPTTYLSLKTRTLGNRTEVDLAQLWVNRRSKKALWLFVSPYDKLPAEFKEFEVVEKI